MKSFKLIFTISLLLASTLAVDNLYNSNDPSEFYEMSSQPDNSYNVQRTTDIFSDEGDVQSDVDKVDFYFGESEKRAWMFEEDDDAADIELDMGIDGAMNPCPIVTQPDPMNPIVYLCDKWYRFGFEMSNMAHTEQMVFNKAGADMHDSIGSSGANWAGKPWSILNNMCNDITTDGNPILDNVCSKIHGTEFALNESTCGTNGGLVTHCSSGDKPYCMIDTGSSGHCIAYKPDDAQRLQTADLLALDPACYHNKDTAWAGANASWKVCATQRCGAPNSLNSWFECLDTLIGHDCYIPPTSHEKFMVRNHDFLTCLKHKKCGPAPEDEALSSDVIGNCKCLATGKNVAKTTDKQYTTGTGANEKPYGLEDCPVIATAIFGNSVDYSSPGETASLMTKRTECLTKNKELHGHCGVALMDKVSVNSTTASASRLASCACPRQNADGTAAADAVHFIGQPVTPGGIDATTQEAVCVGGTYTALDASTHFAGMLEADVPKWQTRIVECTNTPSSVCPAHNQKYSRCERMDNNVCSKHLTDGYFYSSDGQWVDINGYEIDQAIQSSSDFVNMASAFSSCLLQNTMIDINYECHENFIKAIRNKYLVVCFENGKMYGGSVATDLYHKYVDKATTVEILGDMKPDHELIQEALCLEYVTYRGRPHCLAYGEDTLILTEEVQNQYIYPFVRFWLRQSINGEGQEIFLDDNQCSDAAALGQGPLAFNSNIPETYLQDICALKTDKTAQILIDTMKLNFWQTTCEQDGVAIDMGTLIADGETCGSTWTSYCDNGLSCRPMTSYDGSGPYSCVTEANSSFNLRDNDTKGKFYDYSSLPISCHGATPTMANLQHLEAKCMNTLVDQYHWQFFDYTSKADLAFPQNKYLCVNADGQYSVGSHDNIHFPEIATVSSFGWAADYCGLIGDSRVFCDTEEKPACQMATCKAVADVTGTDYKYEDDEFSYDKFAWTCHHADLRFPDQLLFVDQDEWVYNEKEYDSNWDGSYLNAAKKTTLAQFIKQIKYACNFDISYQSWTNPITPINDYQTQDQSTYYDYYPNDDASNGSPDY